MSLIKTCAVQSSRPIKQRFFFGALSFQMKRIDAKHFIFPSSLFDHLFFYPVFYLVGIAKKKLCSFALTNVFYSPCNKFTVRLPNAHAFYMCLIPPLYSVSNFSLSHFCLLIRIQKMNPMKCSMIAMHSA